MLYTSWIIWISKFNMIWLISQLIMQPSISLFQSYHVIFYPRMDLCLVIQARIQEKNLEGISKLSSIELWKQYRRSYYSCIGNRWAQWVTTMHIIGCILCAKSFLDLLVFNAAILFSLCNYPSDDNDRITNIDCGSKGYRWSCNTLKKKVTCIRENS